MLTDTHTHILRHIHRHTPSHIQTDTNMYTFIGALTHIHTFLTWSGFTNESPEIFHKAWPLNTASCRSPLEVWPWHAREMKGRWDLHQQRPLNTQTSSCVNTKRKLHQGRGDQFYVWKVNETEMKKSGGGRIEVLWNKCNPELCWNSDSTTDL